MQNYYRKNIVVLYRGKGTDINKIIQVAIPSSVLPIQAYYIRHHVRDPRLLLVCSLPEGRPASPLVLGKMDLVRHGIDLDSAAPS